MAAEKKDSKRRDQRGVDNAAEGEGRETPHLTKRQLEGLRTALLAKRRQLLGTMSDLRAEIYASQASDDTRSDQLERSGEQEEAQVDAGLLVTQCSQLREIEEALARTEQGTYGICLATGKPIRIERLQARPWAKYCIEHAQQLERQRRR